MIFSSTTKFGSIGVILLQKPVFQNEEKKTIRIDSKLGNVILGKNMP